MTTTEMETTLLRKDIELLSLVADLHKYVDGTSGQMTAYRVKLDALSKAVTDLSKEQSLLLEGAESSTAELLDAAFKPHDLKFPAPTNNLNARTEMELATTIKKNGFTYTQIKRTDKVALYQQRDEAGRHVAYEVGRIKVQKNDATIQGNVIEAGERFWSNEDVGRIAWTFYAANDAEKRYNELQTN